MKTARRLLIMALLAGCDSEHLVTITSPQPDAGLDVLNEPTWSQIGFIGDPDGATKTLGRRLAVKSGGVYASSYSAIEGIARWRIHRFSAEGPAWTHTHSITAEAAGSDEREVEALVATDTDIWAGTVGVGSDAGRWAPEGGHVWRLSPDLSVRDRISSPETRPIAFGHALAVSSRWLIVGDPGFATHQGAVYVYALDGEHVTLTSTLTAPQPAPHQWFGATLALRGDRLLVGAPTYCRAISCETAPKVYVFEFEAGQWRSTSLAAPQRQDRHFGAAATWIDDQVAVVGAPYFYSCVPQGTCVSEEDQLADPDSPSCAPDLVPCKTVGTAYLFDVTQSPLNPSSIRTPPTHIPSVRWGSSLSVNDDWLAVGAPGDPGSSKDTPFSAGQADTGSLTLFRINSIASASQHLKSDDHSKGARFGESLALEEGLLLVGAPFHCGQQLMFNCSRSGAIYIFDDGH